MPFLVHADAEALRDDLKNLFESTDAFSDAELLGANRCILAAASCKFANLTDQSWHAQTLKMAPVEIAQALVDLVHGREVKLSGGADQFFDLFKLAKKMNVVSCMELCQEIVQNGDYDRDIIQLRLSVSQAGAIRKQLHQWRTARLPEWTDVSMRVRGIEATQTRAHLVLLAAHCEYFRALWTGGFKENAATADVTLENSEEAEAANMLLQIIYGDSVEANSEEQLVRLCCLADKWQCSSARSATLHAMETQHAMVATVAVDVLGWEFPAPDVLVQAAVRAIRASQHDGDLTVQSMPMLSACRLLKHLEIDCTDLVLTDVVQTRVLSGLCGEEVSKIALKQISQKTMLCLLQCDSASNQNFAKKLPRNLASWADGSQAGDKLCNVAQLVWEGAPFATLVAIRQAIVQIITEQPSESPMLVYDVMRDAISMHANEKCVEMQWNDIEPVPKRRKTNLLELEPCAKKVIEGAALDWAASNIITVIRCQDWIRLEPSVFVRLVGTVSKKLKFARLLANRQDETANGEVETTRPSAALAVGDRVLRNGKAGRIIEVDLELDPPSYMVRMDDGTEASTERQCLQELNEAEELRSGVAAWIKEAQISVAIEALQLSIDARNSTAVDENMLCDMLLAGIKSRWDEAERLSDVLQGSRHKEDIAAAVDAAQKATESRLRTEFESSIASLRTSLAEEHQQELKRMEISYKEMMDDVQKRVNSVFADVVREAAQGKGA